MAEGLFSRGMTLREMDGVLEDVLSTPRREIRIFADLPITEEDFYLLEDKLVAVKSNLALIERYKISIVTAWVFALRYGHCSRLDCRHIVERHTEVPQYSKRQFLDICNNVFADYGIAMYFSEIHNEEELYTMLVVHAGIPDRVSERFCILLEDLLRTGDIEKAMWRMNCYMDGGLRETANLSDNVFLKNLINTASDIMRDCLEDRYGTEDLLRRYPLTSSKLIHVCADWADKRKGAYECLMRSAV